MNTSFPDLDAEGSSKGSDESSHPQADRPSRSVWLGLDLGNARVGVAISDPELTFAHPEGNIRVAGDYFQAIDKITDLIDDHQVSHVVIGYPLQLDGTEGKSAKKARRFSLALEKRLALYQIQGVSLELKDERMTTVRAHSQLMDAGIGSRRHRPLVDQQSAVLILQAALDDRHSNR